MVLGLIRLTFGADEDQGGWYQIEKIAFSIKQQSWLWRIHNIWPSQTDCAPQIIAEVHGVQSIVQTIVACWMVACGFF